MTGTLYLCGILPQTYNPRLNMRKMSEKSILGTIYKIPDQYSLKRQFLREIVTEWKRRKTHVYMSCGILGGILEQKKRQLVTSFFFF